MLHIKIPLNPYPYDCLLYIGDSEEIFKALESHGLSKEGTEFFMGKVGFAKSEGVEENRNIILWLREPSIVCLVHEAVHVVTFLFDRVGVPISFDNDETLAYTVQYLIREVLKNFGQHFNLAPKIKLDEKHQEELKKQQAHFIYEFNQFFSTLNIAEKSAILKLYDWSNVEYDFVSLKDKEAVRDYRERTDKEFSEKKEKNTVSCSVDPATGDRTTTVSVPITPEDKEKIEAIRDFIKGNAKGYDEYLKVVNLLNTRTSKFFTPSENKGITSDELLKVESILEENKRLKLKLEEYQFVNHLDNHGVTVNTPTGELFLDHIGIERITKWLEAKDLKVYPKNEEFIEFSKYVKLNKEFAELKERLETVRQHNIKVNGLNDELTKELIDSRKIQDKDRGLIDELKEQLEKANQFRDTREEGIAEAFAAIGEPKIDFSKYSEQVLAIFCNRWFETYRKFPTEDQFDRNGLQMIADYLALGTYKEEIKVMLNCYDDNLLNQRIDNLSTVILVTKEWFDKLRSVDNREGGC